MEGHAEGIRISGKPRLRLISKRGPNARLSAHEDGGHDHGARLHRLHSREFSRSGFLPHHFQIKRLAAAHAPDAGGTGQGLHETLRSFGRHRGRRQHSKGLSLQRIARKHRHRFAVAHMRRGTASAERVVVHGGHVVVHETVAVNHFKRERGAVKHLLRRA